MSVTCHAFQRCSYYVWRLMCFASLFFLVLRLTITPTLYLSSVIICCDVAVVLLFCSCFCAHMKKQMYVRIALKWSQNDTKWLPKGCQLEDLKILYILSPILTWFLLKRQFWKSPGAPFKTNDRPKTVQKFQYGHFLAPRYHPWTSKCRYSERV